MSDLPLDEATPADLPAVVALMNAAYREAPPGWASESGLLGGQRTDPVTLAADVAQGTRLLLHRSAGTLAASVQLREAAPRRWYLGGLTIAPVRQGVGLGHAVLHAAEAWIRTRNGTAIEMTVIAQRPELIAWYERRGYARTGETRPFPYGDTRFGEPRRDDLHFLVLEKRL